MSAPNDANGDRWRLDSVSLTNFRGVIATTTYRFAGLSALVWGENGMGKSTLALGLEWTLFGKFPSQAFGAPRPSFLHPVGTTTKGSVGEVVFRRGSQRLAVRRNDEEDEFTVELTGTKTASGDDAIALLENFLGLDQDTFVRAVLLQQSKIRGLLTDEVKERNKALDRLLGMADADALLNVIKPKAFKDAAQEWLDVVEISEAAFRHQQEILEKQYKNGQARARDHGFLNKELNAGGLEARYNDLGQDLARLGSGYGVALTALPTAKNVSDAQKASVGVEKRLNQIRVGADLQKQLVAQTKRMADLQTECDEWDHALGERDAAAKELNALSKQGDARTVHTKCLAFEADIDAREKAVREANELCALLGNVRKYVGREPRGSRADHYAMRAR